MAFKYVPDRLTEVEKQRKELESLKKKYTGFNGINARLEKYNIGSAEYKKALADKKTLDIKVATLEKSIAQKDIVKARENLAKARDKGDSAEITRLTSEVDRLTGTINGQINKDPSISGPTYAADDAFGNALREKGLLVVTDSNGNSYLSSSMQGYEGNNSPHFVYARPSASNSKDIDTQIAYSYTEIEKLVLSDAAKQPGGVDALLGSMYKAGLIKRETYQSRLLESSDFTNGLQYALQEYSKKTVRDYEVNKVKEPITFAEYLNKNLKAPGPSVDYSAQVTTRDTAASDLNRFFIQYVGRGASKEEQDEYYKQLRAAEKKAVVATSTSGSNRTTSGEYLDANDILELQRKVAGKALNGSDIDTVLKSGGEAAQSVNEVLSYARNYGVVLSPKDAMSYVADGLKKGQADTDAIKSKLLAISKATYTNLSDSLSDTVSLKELSGNFINNMAGTLELPYESIDVLDPTIQAALKNNGNKGMMNLTEFDKMLRNDSRWSKTKNAREEAANYAYDILQDFGLMA